MPAISSNDLITLRREKHQVSYYLSTLRPITLWSAVVNDAGISQGDITVAFDGGSGLDFNAIQAPQIVWVGSSIGENDIGIARVRTVSSGDGGITGSLLVGGNSVRWQDNLHLTFIHDYWVNPLWPDIEPDGTFQKDDDILYVDQNEFPEPVVVCGNHRAKFLSGASVTFNLDASDSYPIAQGATISSYGFSVYPTTGSTIIFNAGTGLGSIEFTTVGQRWCRFTVTDSNGRSQNSFRSYWVHNTDPQSENYPIADFNVTSIDGDWNRGGYQASLTLHDRADLESIPQKTLCVLWQEAYYEGVLANITFLPDEDNALLVGYARREGIKRDYEKDADSSVNLLITTIEGVMRNHYMFSIDLSATLSPTTWYEYAPWLTIGRAVHHFLKWHTTVLEVCDVIGLTDNTILRAYTQVEDGNFYTMPDGLSQNSSIRYNIICNAAGQIRFTPDAQLLTDPERALLVEVAELDEMDISGDLEIESEPDKRTPFVYISGFSWDGTFDGDGDPAVSVHCAIAPGNNPDNDGPTPLQVEKQTFSDQTHANRVAGRYFAAENNPYPAVNFTFHGNYWGVLDVSRAEWWTLSLNSGDTPRGLIWTNKKMVLRSVKARISTANGTMQVDVTFEPEAEGVEGIVTDCPTYPDLPGEDPPPPDEEELSGAIVTGSSTYYLPPTSNDWDLRNAEDVLDLGVDPWWTIKQVSEASSSAILIRTGTGYIKRSTDAGLTWSTLNPGDPPGGTFASCEVIRYEGSFAVQDEHLFLVRQTGVGAWLLLSSDDFSSWTWQSLDGGGSESWGTPETCDSNGDFEPGGNNLVGRGIVFLTSTTFICVYSTSSQALMVRAGSVSGTTITLGSPVALATISGFSPSVARIDNNTFICGYRDQSLVLPVNFFALVAGSVSGTTITLGSPVTVASWGDQLGGIISSHLEMMDSTTGVLSYLYSFLTTGYASCYAFTVSGTTVSSVGVEAQFIATRPDQIDMAVLDSTRFALVYEGSCVIGSVSGISITYGTPVNSGISASKWMIARVDNSHFVLFYRRVTPDDTGAIVGSVIGSNITLASPNNGLIAGIFPFNARNNGVDSALLFYRVGGNTLNSAVFDINISSGSVSLVDTLSVNAPINSRVGSGDVIGALYGCIYGNSDFTGVDVVVYGAGSDILPIGLSLGKGGTIAYITGLRSELVLELYDIPSLALIDSIGLGASSPADIVSFNLIAYPFCPMWGTDFDCYIYGRMDSPAGFSGIHHIINTIDGAVSFTANETSWGANHCGALVDDPYGSSYLAIRNIPNQSRLYQGTTMKSTLTFPSQVNSQAMAVDFWDGTVYVAAKTPNAIMILKSSPPYVTWANITYNHGTVDGVKSLKLL